MIKLKSPFPYTLHNGDCLDVMRAMDANSVDTIVCDPPYALTNRTPDVKWCIDCNRVLGGRDGKPDACPKCGGQLEYQRSQGKRGFMGKEWDTGRVAFEPAIWAECLRVAKPGAMLLAFGGTRTHHRLMVAIEDAGWEIRDVIMWLYGSGFPKSHSLAVGIDKQAGALDHRGIGFTTAGYTKSATVPGGALPAHEAITDAAQTWQGWGTALKPAYEPVIMAMKPLDGTFAQNAEKWGVAGLNIDGARIASCADDPNTRTNKARHNRVGSIGYAGGFAGYNSPNPHESGGRFPANLILDDEAAEGQEWARYFYCAKASRREREAGLEGMPERQATELTGRKEGSSGLMQDSHGNMSGNPYKGTAPVTAGTRNFHPTVKPLALMRYLVRLTSTPTGGIVLDPFMGSGTTGIAALQEGRGFVGIELDADYFKIAEKRISNAVAQPALVTA